MERAGKESQGDDDDSQHLWVTTSPTTTTSDGPNNDTRRVSLFDPGIPPQPHNSDDKHNWADDDNGAQERKIDLRGHPAATFQGGRRRGCPQVCFCLFYFMVRFFFNLFVFFNTKQYFTVYHHLDASHGPRPFEWRRWPFFTKAAKSKTSGAWDVYEHPLALCVSGLWFFFGYVILYCTITLASIIISSYQLVF